MRIETFWVVTDPWACIVPKDLELCDICFEATPDRIGLQFLGGLKPADVVGFYTEELEAKERARALLERIPGHALERKEERDGG